MRGRRVPAAAFTSAGPRLDGGPPALAGRTSSPAEDPRDRPRGDGHQQCRAGRGVVLRGCRPPGVPLQPPVRLSSGPGPGWPAEPGHGHQQRRSGGRLGHAGRQHHPPRFHLRPGGELDHAADSRYQRARHRGRGHQRAGPCHFARADPSTAGLYALRHGVRRQHGHAHGWGLAHRHQQLGPRAGSVRRGHEPVTLALLLSRRAHPSARRLGTVRDRPERLRADGRLRHRHHARRRGAACVPP
jgi:hypothetical protein